MSDPDRDAQINNVCQLAEHGGSQRLLSRDGARLRFGRSKEAHEDRMVVGVMVGTLLAAVTVPLLFLPGGGLLTAALGLIAAIMIALVVVPMVGRQREITVDLDAHTITVQKGDRTVREAPAADVRVFFHKDARRKGPNQSSASVSLRLSGDRSAQSIVLVNEVEVSDAREIHELLVALLSADASA